MKTRKAIMSTYGRDMSVCDRELFAAEVETDRELAEQAVKAGACLRGANLSGFDLRGCDLRGRDLRYAKLDYADLRGCDLTDAILRSVSMRDADLRGTIMTGAILRDADMRGCDLSAAIFGDVPIIPHIDRAVLTAFESGGYELDMAMWHTCGTTHCRGGMAIHLAGAAGYALEDRVGRLVAATLIYLASRPGMPIPSFYTTEDLAMADIRACASA